MSLEISPFNLINNTNFTTFFPLEFQTKNENDSNVNSMKSKQSLDIKLSGIKQSTVKKVKLKPNLVKASYNNRFFRTIKRLLYFKTIKQQHRRLIEDIEKIYNYYLNMFMPKIERKEKYKRLLSGTFSNVIPMAYRVYCYTKVFVTHHFRNTFVTVFKGNKTEKTNEFEMKPVGKYSCGLIGYQGPKKATTFARKEVIKESGNFLGSLMTTLLTVVFTSKVSRWNRKSVRNLCPNLSYVLTIFIDYKRPHGIIKQKNRRRT